MLWHDDADEYGAEIDGIPLGSNDDIGGFFKSVPALTYESLHLEIGNKHGVNPRLRRAACAHISGAVDLQIGEKARPRFLCVDAGCGEHTRMLSLTQGTTA